MPNSQELNLTFFVKKNTNDHIVALKPQAATVLVKEINNPINQ